MRNRLSGQRDSEINAAGLENYSIRLERRGADMVSWRRKNVTTISDCTIFNINKELACVAGGIRDRASGGGAAIIPSRAKPGREFASGKASSEH